VYKKFDQGLSKDLKETKTGSTCCDQYAAAYRAGETSKTYREIMKQTKNWPSALEEGKEQLDGVLKKIGKEADSILMELKSDVKGNATEQNGRCRCEPNRCAKLPATVRHEPAGTTSGNFVRPTKLRPAAVSMIGFEALLKQKETDSGGEVAGVRKESRTDLACSAKASGSAAGSSA
jgi:hypothetical protein